MNYARNLTIAALALLVACAPKELSGLEAKVSQSAPQPSPSPTAYITADVTAEGFVKYTPPADILKTMKKKGCKFLKALYFEPPRDDGLETAEVKHTSDFLMNARAGCLKKGCDIVLEKIENIYDVHGSKLDAYSVWSCNKPK